MLYVLLTKDIKKWNKVRDDVRLAERSKAPDLSSGSREGAWVRTPHLTKFFLHIFYDKKMKILVCSRIFPYITKKIGAWKDIAKHENLVPGGSRNTLLSCPDIVTPRTRIHDNRMICDNRGLYPAGRYDVQYFFSQLKLKFYNESCVESVQVEHQMRRLTCGTYMFIHSCLVRLST